MDVKNNIVSFEPPVGKGKVVGILTTDGVTVFEGGNVWYIGVTLSNPTPIKRVVTSHWLHGNPYNSYQHIFSTESKCSDFIKNKTK